MAIGSDGDCCDGTNKKTAEKEKLGVEIIELKVAATEKNGKRKKIILGNKKKAKCK